MDCAGDIVGISIPFTFGVMTAAFLPGLTAVCCWWAALSASVFASALLILLCGRNSSRITAYALYFFLGLFCFCTARIRATDTAEGPTLAKTALDKLVAVIDGIGFKGQTGPLVKALLTGQRSGLDRQTVEDFRNAGASHILALSGLHLGIIYGVISVPLRCIGRSRATFVARSILCTGITGAYAVITGASPSIIRAFIFITLNELARLHPERRRSSARIFCTALTLQLAVSPTVILETGFQLSYLAMLGIIVIFPKIKDWYPSGARFDPFRRIWNSIAMSVSCQLFTAPLVWLLFGSFPIYFLLTNLIALPLTELLIVCALLTIASSATGIGTAAAKSLTESIGQALGYCLNVISGM